MISPTANRITETKTIKCKNVFKCVDKSVFCNYYIKAIKNACLAQSVEHAAVNRSVGGSSPSTSANKYMAPVNKQVFFFLSPRHCAIGKARFLADPLCGLQIQSALPLCRKAGFSAVKGYFAKRYYGVDDYGSYMSLASANKKLAPVDKQVFLFYLLHTARRRRTGVQFWVEFAKRDNCELRC